MKKLSLPTLAAAFLISKAAAAQEDFLDRFTGTWSGSGTVQVNFQSEPRRVNCSLTGTSAGRSVSTGGTCRAYLVFTRRIGVDLSFDPQSQRYVGTYTGSTAGTARLSGTRQGDGLTLTVTWPKVINGDRTAQMRVINDGSGNLRIIMTDRVGGEGEPRTMTNIALERT